MTGIKISYFFISNVTIAKASKDCDIVDVE
jgi:hypothetical protein